MRVLVEAAEWSNSCKAIKEPTARGKYFNGAKMDYPECFLWSAVFSGIGGTLIVRAGFKHFEGESTKMDINKRE